VARVASARLLVLVISACYSPHQPDCGFFCGPDGACPSDYHCAADGRCHRDGTPETLVCPPDAAVAAPDVMADADVTSPHVASTTPADNATGVALSMPVTVIFDEPVQGVDATTLSAGVTATVTATSATEYVLSPAADWPASTQITVQLAAGIHDAAGNALAPTSFSFTTTP
jgi:hypothetical protein